jgi:hypothetical protein
MIFGWQEKEGKQGGEEQEEEGHEQQEEQEQEEEKREREGRRPLILRGETVEEVKEFKYLGVYITTRGNDWGDMKKRIEKAWGVFKKLKKKVWRQRALSRKTKMVVFKMMVMPVLTYGMESCTLTAREEEKVQAAQMSMLRSLLRVRWQEHRTNVSILEEVGMMGVGDVMRRARLTWVAKVLRMGWERLPKMVLCGMLEGGKRQIR